MKRIKIALFLLTFINISIFAQKAAKFEVKKVDFEKIREEISGPNSKYYYPKLMSSYLSNDTVLDFEGYRHLYYGYTFQEDYNPFRESEFSQEIEPLYYKKEFTRAECDSIEKFAEKTLNDNIFDFRQMNFYIFALREKKKLARASIRQYRLNHLVAAILSSGSGTKESPWVVISPNHEYDLLNFLGYVATDYKELDNKIDYITVNKVSKKSPEGFYFDASRIFEVANEKFPPSNEQKN